MHNTTPPPSHDNDAKSSYVKKLEQQVFNLTRDCYYLMSLISDNDSAVDWDSWPEGATIKSHLAESKRIEEKIVATAAAEKRAAELRRIQEEREGLKKRLEALEHEEHVLSHGVLKTPDSTDEAEKAAPRTDKRTDAKVPETSATELRERSNAAHPELRKWFKGEDNVESDFSELYDLFSQIFGDAMAGQQDAEYVRHR